VFCLVSVIPSKPKYIVVNIAGAVSFILYRRRFLNKPQTLNDKCSNPDSSGYIDDSTLRVSAQDEQMKINSHAQEMHVKSSLWH
jgi:tRNA C32,U32 (ribose-2'-O)-methylase TrmJ